MARYKYLTVASLTLLLLAACGTMDDIYGGSGNDYQIRGTVDHVDSANRVLYLTNVSGYNNMLSGGSSNSVRVYYDNDTTVGYQGQTYRVTDLERGDEVSVDVDESGNQLHAESVTVTRDVSSTGSSYPGSSLDMVRGTVRYVDTGRRTIEVDRGSGSLITVDYETSTPVYWNNQTYRATDLERGDEVEIRLSNTGSSQWLARDITVIRSVSSGSVGSSSQTATIRGTVRYVDTARRTIELESVSWASGFNSGANTGSRVIVSYGSNTNVSVSGTMHPVSGLERGDVIEVQVRDANATTPFADRIYLIRDVRN